MKNFYFLFLLFLSFGVNAQNYTVTSLADDASTGTLRWAINQANSNPDYSVIDFDANLNGTITLTSNLPSIYANLNITGSGKEKIVISGNDLYAMFNVDGGSTFSISSISLTKCGEGTWGVMGSDMGAMISVDGSTATANDILITGNSKRYLLDSRRPGSYLTITNSIISNNTSNPIFTSDHGNTPSTTEVDTNYENRIMVSGSTFSDNTGVIFYTERFVKIDNSTFSGNTNTIGFFRGLNRYQVLNSTFTNNTGNTLFSFYSSLGTQGMFLGTLGDNHHLFDSNTFTGNSGTTINTGTDNEQQKTTITNNTFTNNGTNWTGTPKMVSTNYLDDFISSVQYENNNNTIVVTMSKPVFSGLNSIGNVDINDFKFELTGGNATLVSSNPSSFSINGNTIILGIQLNGVLSSFDDLKVIPIANSIYDAGNNIAGTVQKNNSLKLNYSDDFISSVEHDLNNSTIIVTMSRPVFSGLNSIGDVDINDFKFQLTGGNATLASVLPSSFSKNGNTITLGIQLNGLSSGAELLKVIPVANSIYDAGNNIAGNVQRNDSINLKFLDADSDGVSDLSDLCPNTPTASFVDANGCPDPTAGLIWNGPYITFTKNNDADYSLPENQDFISDDVRITRGNNQGLYNAATEPNFNMSTRTSPSGTLWAEVSHDNLTTTEINALNFQVWNYAIGFYPPGMIGKTFLVYLPAEKIYFYVKLLSWTAGGSGGGFSYQRTTCQSAPITINSFSPSSGGVGTQIVILGNDLNNVVRVTVGNKDVESFTIDSPNQITASIALASNGKVALYNPCKNEASTNFTYNFSTPLISSFSPNRAGETAEIEILGSNIAGTSAVSFGGINALSFTVESDTKILAYVGTGATGAINITNPAGTGSINGFNFIPEATRASISGTLSIDNVPNFTTSVIDSTIVVGSNGTIKGAKVQITGGYVSGSSGDILDYSGTLPTGFSLSYDDSKGLLNINGFASSSVWESILRKITIKSTNSNCYPEQRLITFNLGDKYYNPLTGHWYEYLSDGTSWSVAKAKAANQTYFGKLGYLSTVTSPAENNFIWKIMTSDAWLGGSDDYEQINTALGRIAYANTAESEGKFHWVTGPESGTQLSEGNTPEVTAMPGQFANWAGGEPNGRNGSEGFIQFYSGYNGLWNDLPNGNSWSLGALVEYGGLSGDDNTSVINFTKELKIDGSTSGSITGGGINVCSGTNATLLTLSGNSGAILRWEYSLDNFYTDGVIINNTNSTYTVENITQTTYYRAVISCGGSEVNTGSVTISVKPTISGNIVAENNTICQGGDIKLTLLGKQGDVVMWQVSTDQIVWNDILNTNTVLSRIADNQGVFHYRAVVKTPGCGSEVYSASYPITVVSGQAPVGGSVSSEVLTNGISSGELTITGFTGDISKWQSSTNEGLIWNDISNTSSTLNFSGLNTNSLFRAVVVNGACGFTYSSVGSVTLIFNSAPSDIGFSSMAVNENSLVGTHLALLSSTDSDADDRHTYSLVSGTGDTDNASFEIVGRQLKVKALFDYETKRRYSIRVRSTDNGSLNFENTFTITIMDVNELPTSLALSANSINENSAVGTTLANLSSTDLDAHDMHTYSLVAGSGDADNASFEIVGNELKVKELFDFEKKSSYTLRIRTTDAGGLSFDNSFAITINDVNELPSAIALSANSINENSAISTTLANLSSTDADTNDTHTYSLVAGSGDTDNASFEIVGNELKVKELFDFEKKSSYTLRLRTTDAGGLSFDNSFSITINNVNELPTAIALSANSINENSAISTTLANLSSTDVDVNDTHTFSLVAGSGDTNNASFEIVGNELKVKELFDFEKKSSYTLRIRTTDAGGLSFDNSFAITINNVNELPTAIALSANSINENSAIGTTLANLSSTDVDANDTHIYSLVSGAGASNNASFEIVGNELKVKELFDFEKKSSYTIRLRTIDTGGLSFENSFAITINNVNELPTVIALNANSINENSAIGTTLANLSSTDSDANDAHTYSLVAGSGDVDNASFEIVGNELKVKELFDFEKKSSYTIRLRTTDAGGLSFDNSFAITINNVNELPTVIALSANSINENSAIGTTLANLSSTDVDANDTHIYSLVSGAGASNNASFEIVGSELKVKELFDFEKKSSYTIRIRTTDTGGLFFENSFSINITDVNEAPTALAVNRLNLYEGNRVDELIGLMSSTDQDAGDAHTYSLVAGTGSTDNAAFKILNGQIYAAQVFSFEAKNSYSVRLRTTDAGGLSHDQAFTITVSQKPVITGTGNETFPNTRVAASANPSISLGYGSDLFVSGADIVSYNWSPSTGLNSSTISNPTASPKATTTYTVEVTNRLGSKTTLSITVSVREDYNVTPTNILSPNGDGQNDGWIIENLSSYPNNKVTIVDRSGLLIYTKINYTNDWNGQFNGVALPEGTYYYIIALNGGKGEKTGFITIVN